MRNNLIIRKTLIKRNTSTVGEFIETKIERIVTQNEPIEDGAPLIYTEKADGVLPEYDIRSGKFDIAIDAMDKANKGRKMQSMGKPKEEPKGEPGGEPKGATE